MSIEHQPIWQSAWKYGSSGGHCGHTFIESGVPATYSVRRGTTVDPRTTKQKSKICPGVTPQDLPSGVHLRSRGNFGIGREDR